MTDTNAVTTSPKHPLVILRERLESRVNEIRAATPPDIAPERVIRAIITAAQLDPNLLACQFQSLFLAIMRSCRDGLLPDGREGVILCFKDKAQWIPMYQGLIRRFESSGRFKWITANCVYEGDEFEHWIDENGEHFRHVPSDAFDNKPIVKVYAMATTKDGGTFIAVMPRAEIDKIRKMSRAGREDSPWNQHFQEMAKKTALRRLAKLLPTAPIATEEYEQDESPPPAPPAAATPLRARGAAAALSQFAASAPASSAPLTETEANGGEPGEIDTEVSAARTTEADFDPAAAADAIAEAWEHGKKAKADGIQRRALPPELRTSDRTREAIAWQAGHDGKELPAFFLTSDQP